MTIHKLTSIRSLPKLRWSQHAAEEIAVSGQELLDETDFMWQVGNVAICGLIYTSYLSPPWFWFALAEGVTMRDLIDFRRLAEMIPFGTYTAVRTDRPIAIRFAKFYGFYDTDVHRIHSGLDYTIFRRG